MSPESKLLLDEIEKMFSDQNSRFDKKIQETDLKWEQRFGDLEKKKDERLSKIETVASTLEDWRPEIEATVEDIRLEVTKLTKHWDRAVLNGASGSSGLMAQPESAAVRSPAGTVPDWPSGHRVEQAPREGGFGSVMTLLHPPVKDLTHLWRKNC
ncbi:unnamed protein product [Urochloa decumbens]|uniref:Uncharacterized protein n=1 Tax=Urochloa decumbens TaxID=240449 RepID=A0ABC8VFG6_9POAL